MGPVQVVVWCIYRSVFSFFQNLHVILSAELSACTGTLTYLQQGIYTVSLFIYLSIYKSDPSHMGLLTRFIFVLNLRGCLHVTGLTLDLDVLFFL